jgi:hypothetical protein
MEEGSQNKRRLKLNLKPSRIILALVIIVAISAAGYFYIQNKNTQNLLNNPNQASLEESKVVLEKVGKLIELPTNESPTVATVSDVTKLSDQPFFRNAKNGDKVLIYSQAQKAILYRPSLNKIIEVAPVNIGADTKPNTNPTASITQSPSITPQVTPTVTKAPLLSPQPTQ